MQAPHRKIKLPPPATPTPEELARRREARNHILKIRAEMQPLGVDVAGWIREDREGDEAEADPNG